MYGKHRTKYYILSNHMIISYHIISFQLVLVGEGDRGEKREREKKGRERESCGFGHKSEWAQDDSSSNLCSCSFGHRVGLRWLKKQAL